LWSSSQPETPVLDLALARAAPIVIVLLLIHSAMDYPLRTPALSVLFAVACACLVPRRSIEAQAYAGAERPEIMGRQHYRYKALGLSNKS
jgi:hypothetical protein